MRSLSTDRMLAYVALGGDGEITVHQGTYIGPMDTLIYELPAAALILLDLFNESRPHFDWDEDASRAATLLLWGLEAKGYHPRDMDEYERQMRKLCTPGPTHGGGFVVMLMVES